MTHSINSTEKLEKKRQFNNFKTLLSKKNNKNKRGPLFSLVYVHLPKIRVLSKYIVSKSLTSKIHRGIFLNSISGICFALQKKRKQMEKSKLF